MKNIISKLLAVSCCPIALAAAATAAVELEKTAKARTWAKWVRLVSCKRLSRIQPFMDIITRKRAQGWSQAEVAEHICGIYLNPHDTLELITQGDVSYLERTAHRIKTEVGYDALYEIFLNAGKHQYF